MSSQVGNNFTTNDATATSVTSPVAYTNAATKITIPPGAGQITIIPTTDLRVSELSTIAQYDIIKANTKEIIDCSNMKAIYITQDSANGSAYFKFIFI